MADLYKTETTIPVAFETAALGAEEIESRVRQRMRQKLRETKLLQRILPDLDTLLAVDLGLEQDDLLDEDSAMPTPWWDDDDESLNNFEEGEEWSS